MKFKGLLGSFGATAILVLLCLVCDAVQGLKCYQCNSLEDYDCGEKFDPKVSKIQPKECKAPNAQYCIKSTGIFEGQLGTKRFCSDRYLHNFCDYIRRPGDGREYRSCIYTCQGEACNGSSGMALSLATLVGAFLLIGSLRQ
ncbi:UPAR/Ly6 domain-containing protein bou-like isoform X2 [Artemia franciscana]|uniref:UPAR/Ly6 domain-containing protein bou-like isoform X2 n=1 Tax=Artemia franciscana TaxID=6661 RepID=UPI0032DAE2EF